MNVVNINKYRLFLIKNYKTEWLQNITGSDRTFLTNEEASEHLSHSSSEELCSGSIEIGSSYSKDRYPHVIHFSSGFNNNGEFEVKF